MRRPLLLAVVLSVASPVAAQQPAVPAAAPRQSQAQDSASDLPVSLERIREGLRRAPERPLLASLDRAPDFAVQVEEREHVEALLAKLDFSSGPAPAGGLYAYEQQRRLFSPASQPLMQPYSAFSGGQLVTVALQNLIRKYLGGRVLNAVSAAERSRANREAREEVDQAIAAYCAVHPDRDSIQLCTRDTAR